MMIAQPSATRPLFGTNLLRTWILLSSFDETSLLFETTRQHFRPRNVVLAIAELSRTITRFHQNDDNVIQAMRTFQTFTPKFQPEFVIDSFDELSEMSAWLGQRYHYFDEISLLLETTRQSLGPRNVV